MECFHPLTIPYVVDGKKTRSYHTVPCGHCYACRKKIHTSWIFRMSQELKKCKQSVFITLTYETEPTTPEGVQTVRKKDIQDFLKRLRKRLPVGSLRYYIASEYGPTTLRPHYHGILFNFSGVNIEPLILDAWQNGFVTIKPVNENRIAYTCKYCMKEGIEPPGAAPVFALSSRNPAIGLCYLDNEDNVNYHDTHSYITLKGGRKIGLPRYYRDKLGVALDTSELKTLEEEYMRAYPDRVKLVQNIATGEWYETTGVDFYIWRDQRIKAFEENERKRSKFKSQL